MEKFTEELNKFTNNKYDFMLKSALFKQDADFCLVEILYKDGVMFTPSLKKEIEEFAVSFLPQDIKYEFNFIKRYISEERIFEDSKLFLEKNYPSVASQITSVKLNDGKFEISVLIDDLSYKHAINQKVNFEIEKFLKQEYSNFDYSCSLEKGSVYIEDKKQEIIQNFTEENTDIYANRKIEFFDIVPLVGEFVDGEKADYIKDKTKPEEQIIVCGKIQSIQEKVINRKPKQVKTDEQSSEENALEEEKSEDVEAQPEEQSLPKYQRKIYKFALADFTGEINCVFFSNKENQAKIEKLDVGSVIVARGNLEADEYSGGNTLKVKDLAYCSLPENQKEYIEYKKEKPFYEFVEPEKIVTYSQDNLLNFTEEKQVPKFLQDKIFVCYDFETTGLHYVNGDKIIEIGAVKIENGKITEKFMSFIDPEKHIPEDASAISGIVDSDVQGSPTADKVLQDFYKFTRGAIIIGYNNINFDNIFLIGQGKDARWNFDNETDDVYRWAQKYVRGAKNYKLKTIADKLGVTLDNAHRAVYDALATAEVFIKIHEIYQNDIENTLK